MFIYSLLRLYGFGIHAKKSWQCWLTTLPVYIGGCYFIRYGVLVKEIVSVIWILGLLSFIFFAPADTASRPLIHKEKRVRAKVLALLIYICLYIVNIYYPSQELINATMLAIIMQSIVMNPLTYRICHAPYKNYKKYVKAV